MPTIHYILHNGSTQSVDATSGTSVMQAAIQANVRGIDAECGGSCSCATCHVYVAEDWIPRLPPPDEMENELLEGVCAGREPGSRLSCQITVSPELDGLTVRVPSAQG